MTIPWKEWENPNGEWKHHCPGMSPYKDHFAPLRLVPGCDKPHHILLDFCHIFHLGYGLDMGSSSIILLCILGHWGHSRKLDDALEIAYEKFNIWCKKNHRTSAINDFSKQSFGMGGCLS